MAPFKHRPDNATTGHDSAPVRLDDLPAPTGPPADPAPPTVIPSPAPVAAQATSAPPAHEDPPLVVPRTRTSAAYGGLAVGLLVLVLVIIFIAQNLNDATVHFLSLHFRLPIGLLILASVVAGGILVLLVSAARVAQLRLMARRHRAGKPTH